MYWLDKINLFKRSSLYYAGNIAISNYLFKTLQFSLLIFAAAMLFFTAMKQDKLDFVLLAASGVAFVYAMFVVAAPRGLERCFFGAETESGRFIYDDCVSEGKFDATYWTDNPATFLVEESSITQKRVVTNPALMRTYPTPEDYQRHLPKEES